MKTTGAVLRTQPAGSCESQIFLSEDSFRHDLVHLSHHCHVAVVYVIPGYRFSLHPGRGTPPNGGTHQASDTTPKWTALLRFSKRSAFPRAASHTLDAGRELPKRLESSRTPLLKRVHSTSSWRLASVITSPCSRPARAAKQLNAGEFGAGVVYAHILSVVAGLALASFLNVAHAGAATPSYSSEWLTRQFTTDHAVAGVANSVTAAMARDGGSVASAALERLFSTEHKSSDVSIAESVAGRSGEIIANDGAATTIADGWLKRQLSSDHGAYGG